MSSGQSDICNLALNHIGMSPIRTIDDDNESAIACKTFWNPSRDDIFSEHRWAFATYQRTLALVANVIVGWSYVYGYPVNVSRVWNVYNAATVKQKEEQEFEKLFIPGDNINILCSNNAEALADCTYVVEDTSIWDAKFVFAFSYRLAAAIAKPLTGDGELAKEMMLVYNGMLNEAKRVGFSEKMKKPNNESATQKSRNG